MIYKKRLHKVLNGLILLTFVSGQVLPPSLAAQPASVLNLPLPGAMVGVSPSYVPIAIKGIKVFPDNPFRFDFLLDTGHSKLDKDRLNEETKLLVKYFLTALTIPDKDQWVNLSPYENDRIVPNEFGITEMGRDLLAQDYLLKQLTASLVYPEQELGKKFWENVYKKAYEKYGDADIPMSTFNKVWVLPDHATVYQHGDTAVITESRLRVLLEEDYLALTQGAPASQNPGEPKEVNSFGSQIVREIVLPEIEKEINEGKNFAKLRQIYQSMILAAWFKRKLKDGILNKMYVGKNKVAGVDTADKEIKEKIYQQYVAAYKKGVYNYIREDINERTQEVVPRKYFSGGVVAGLEVDKTTEVIPVTQQQQEQAAGNLVGDSLTASVGLNSVDQAGESVISGAYREQVLDKPSEDIQWEFQVFDSEVGPENFSDRNLGQKRIGQLEDIHRSIMAKFKETTAGLNERGYFISDSDFSGLVDNAIDAIFWRIESIEGSLARARFAKEARIRFLYTEDRERGTFKIVLSDSGIGIDKEVFDRWVKDYGNFSTKPSGMTRYLGGSGNFMHRIFLKRAAVRQWEINIDSKYYHDEYHFHQDRSGQKIFFKADDLIDDGTRITISGSTSSVPAVSDHALTLASGEREFLGEIMSKEAMDRHEQDLAWLFSITGYSYDTELAFRRSKELFAEDFDQYLPGIIEILRGVRSDDRGSVVQGLLETQEVFGGDFYKYWEQWVQIGRLAGENASLIFRYGFPLSGQLIERKEDVGLVGAILLELAQKDSGVIFSGLPAVKDLIKTQNDLKDVGGVLLQIGESIGSDSNHFFRNILPLYMGFINDVRDFKTAGNALVGLARSKFPFHEESEAAIYVQSLSELELLSGELKSWKGHENNLEEFFQYAKEFRREVGGGPERVKRQGLIREILAKGTPNYTNVLSRLLYLRAGEHKDFFDFVLNPNIELSSRMVIADYYVESVVVKEAFSRRKGVPDNPALNEFDQAVSSTQEKLRNAILELSNTTLSRSKQRKILVGAKKALYDLREVTLKLVLGRSLSERESRLIQDRRINQSLITIISVVATLNLVDFKEKTLMRKFVKDVLEELFAPPGDMGEDEDPVVTAQARSNRFVASLTRDVLDPDSEELRSDMTLSNKKMVGELVEVGYSPELWTKGVEFEMETANGLTEEGKRENIRRASYEMVEIALAAGINQVNGQEITLEGAASIDSYDHAKGFLDGLERSRTMIAEDRMERLRDVLHYIQVQEGQRSIEVSQKAKFRVTIKKDFLSEAAAGLGVPGCFNPTGIHREMPLIHALESNAGFIQVYSENGKQVANAVIIYTKDGVYVDPLHNSSFFDLEEIFGKALVQLTRYVPRLVLSSTSAGSTYLSRYAKPLKGEITVVKPSTLFADQYFDAGATDGLGTLTLKISNPLMVTKEDIIARDGSLDFVQSEVTPDLTTPVVADINLDDLAKSLIARGEKYKTFLFLVGSIKQKIVQEGEAGINDSFYEWVYNAVKSNVRTAQATLEESDEVADLILDYLEDQKWPIRIETPPRALKEEKERISKGTEDKTGVREGADENRYNSQITGGALKQIGVLGKEQSVGVSKKTLDRWADLAAAQNLQQREIVPGETITAKVIQIKNEDGAQVRMPEGLFAYHFRDAQGDLVIVLSNDLATDEIDEAIYHEFREDYWEQELAARAARGELSAEDEGRIPWISHVLASAEESVAFGQDMDAITAYHARQIRSLENGQLRALISEDRQAHQQVISRYLTEQQSQKYSEYEETMRDAIQKALSARRSVDRLNVEVPVFEGIESSAFFDPQGRIETIERIRRLTVAKINEAFLSTGETKGAIAYEIDRLAGAAVDSIVEGLQDSYGDPARQEAYLREAKVSLSYERDDTTGKFKVTLSDNGAGMSREVLSRLSGFYLLPADPQKRSLGESADSVIKGLIGGAMRYNQWEEVAVVTRTPGARQPLLYTTRRTGINDADAPLERGTEVTITGRSLAWSSRQERSRTEDNANDVGGIDMNQNALNIQTEGTDIQLDVPFDPAQWENIQIEGFSPVILQINTTNLPLFIGSNEPEKTIQLSSV